MFRLQKSISEIYILINVTFGEKFDYTWFIIAERIRQSGP